ncbi:uncharacterized protein LOC124993763 [Sciurus carolinensis]|uniref:uncharacterized protein LOC124993763 n=1 Tax=Sciurus carolinensis TaxID=30640 RepID=UPI001FB3541A|nr:uncharacterized protein LOC124993763 [Sciurus carolinensis]
MHTPRARRHELWIKTSCTLRARLVPVLRCKTGGVRGPPEHQLLLGNSGARPRSSLHPLDTRGATPGPPGPEDESQGLPSLPSPLHRTGRPEPLLVPRIPREQHPLAKAALGLPGPRASLNTRPRCAGADKAAVTLPVPTRELAQAFVRRQARTLGWAPDPGALKRSGCCYRTSRTYSSRRRSLQHLAGHKPELAQPSPGNYRSRNAPLRAQAQRARDARVQRAIRAQAQWACATAPGLQRFRLHACEVLRESHSSLNCWSPGQ